MKLRAEFDNNDEKLFPNQFVNARLLVRWLREVVTVRYTGTNAFALSDATVNAPGATTGSIAGFSTGTTRYGMTRDVSCAGM